MKVNRIIFREMGEYNDMSVRPFHSDFDNNTINKLVDVTEGGQHLTPNTLAGISIGMMRPSAESHGVAHIASGWGETRLMFLMEVEIHTTPNSSVVEVISGYTDHLGATPMGTRKVALDPNMRLYFNSTFNVKRLLAVGSRGNEWKGNIYDSAQIVTRTELSDLSKMRSGTGTMTMRPEDIIVRANISDEYRELSEGAGFRDTRAEFDRRALKISKRSNTQSSSYLGATLGALRDSEEDDFLDTNQKTRLSAARAQVRERLISADPVFEELAADTAIMNDGFVTWGELTAMNPDIDDMADVFFADKSHQTHRRGDTENWGGSDNETMAATIIANTIPAYLIDAMYSKIEFTCTNDTRGGVFETKIAQLVPFIPETDVSENYNYLVSQIEHQLMPEILFNKTMSVFIHVVSTLYGDTQITIAFDAEPEARFTYPTFCDSVASPIITNSREVIDAMAKDVTDIYRQLREVSSSRTSPSTSRALVPTSSKGRHI